MVLRLSYIFRLSACCWQHYLPVISLLRRRVRRTRKNFSLWLKPRALILGESDSGRAFEINETGEVVWEFVNIVGDGKVGLVHEVQRLSSEAASLFANAN